MSSHTLCTFTKDHLDGALSLSMAEGWPHRREDWEMLLKMSGGVVALESGKVVGTALRTDYGPDVSALNMIIVAESARGSGLGRKLMQAITDGQGHRELRLIATQAGLPLYEKLGFQGEGEIIQCQGEAGYVDPPETRVFPLGVDAIDEIATLDRHYFAADRSTLLQWLAHNGELAVTRSADGLATGYAVKRRFGRGQVIGPIFAPAADQAKDLIRHFQASRSGGFLRVDTDEALGLAPWLEDIGLTSAGTGVKMRKNAKAHQRPAFGLCSQALG